MISKKTIGFLAAALTLGAVAPTFAQPQPGQPDPNQPQQRRQFDPAQFRQMMIDRLKEAMNASDDEMKALQPQIEKVMQLSRDARAGGMGGFGRRPGGGDPNQQQQQPSAVQQRQQELQTAVENKDTPPNELKAKIDALRAAKNAARAELAKAQDDLRGLLTQRQEAVLITFGILE